MDIRKTYKREEVEEKYTWDLTNLFKNYETFEYTLSNTELMAKNFVKKYKNNINSANIINKSLADYREIAIKLNQCAMYTNLAVQVDNTNSENMAKHMNCMARVNNINTNIGFFKNEILNNTETVIKEAIDLDDNSANTLKKLLEEKDILLSDEAEEILSKFNLTFGAFERIYNASKLQDMNFPDFEANGKMHPLSYNIYEGLMENHLDLEMRRNSFRVFSDKLDEYKNVTAATYLAHCQKEKTEATLRGFDSVIDFLLFEQRIPRELYDRQIDIIMKDLSPIMRRYARLLKKVHQLDEIKYEDLKIDLDPDFSKVISVEDSKDILLDGLSILGDEYTNMINRAFNERWIDFVNNTGKSTGAFCASPYGVTPFILISWTGKMTEAMVLAHELGHAGHFYLNNQEQNIMDTRPSSYFIEAPSTTNELIMANHLLRNAKDDKERRYYLSQIISRTYYHNFVTHLLEAAFQREVYYLIDEGKTFSADTLSDIFLNILKKFWGDDVVLTKGAELTWMRQPHYYMGLYPYTYSAGLTIGTEVSKKILDEGKPAVDRWLDTLKLGGTKDSIELAKNAGVDIKTDRPLKNTINYIGDIIDELEKLTEKLK